MNKLLFKSILISLVVIGTQNLHADPDVYVSPVNSPDESDQELILGSQYYTWWGANKAIRWYPIQPHKRHAKTEPGSEVTVSGTVTLTGESSTTKKKVGNQCNSRCENKIGQQWKQWKSWWLELNQIQPGCFLTDIAFDEQPFEVYVSANIESRFSDKQNHLREEEQEIFQNTIVAQVIIRVFDEMIAGYKDYPEPMQPFLGYFYKSLRYTDHKTDIRIRDLNNGTVSIHETSPMKLDNAASGIQYGVCFNEIPGQIERGVQFEPLDFFELRYIKIRETSFE